MAKRSYLRYLYDKNKIRIISSMPEFDFDPDKQIGEDMIDLRLNPLAKCLKADVTIDLLEDNTEQYLEKVILTAEGYILKPGEILFCSTLEKIRITSRQHIGLIFGRPTIATYGLSVALNQSKVPIDLPWNFPLQLCNNTQRDIKIYPFVTIVQILLIEYPYGDLGAYKREGKYKNQQLAEQYPGIIGDERSDLQFLLGKWKEFPSDYDFKKNTQEANKKIREGVKRYKIPTIRWLNYFLEWLIPLSTAIVTYMITNYPDIPGKPVIIGGYVLLMFILSYFKTIG